MAGTPVIKYETYASAVKLGPDQQLHYQQGKGYFAGPKLNAVAPTPNPTLSTGVKTPGSARTFTDPRTGLPTKTPPKIAPPARTVTPKAKAPAAPYDPFAPLTPAQLDAQAAAEANAGLTPQSDAISAQRAAAAAQAKQDEEAITGFNTAAAGLLAGIAPQVGAGYDAAAREIGQIGTASGQGVEDTLSTEEQAARDFAASQGQTGATGAGAENPAATGATIDLLGGKIPATSLASQGAAAQAQAAMQPAIQLDAGRAQLQDRMNQAVKDDDTYAQQLITLAATYPDLKAKALAALNDYEIQKANYRQSVAKTAWDEKFQVGKANEAIAEFNARQAETHAYHVATTTLAAQRVYQEGVRLAQQKVQQDRMFGIALKRLGISQKSLQLRIAAQAYAAANGGYTQKQIAAFNTKLDTLESSAVATRPVNGAMPTPTPVDKNGKAIKIDPNTGQPVSKPAGWINDHTYSAFIVAALKKGIPLQLAVARADTIFPETQRTLSPALKQLNSSVLAAESGQAAADHAQTVGQTPAPVSNAQTRQLQSYAYSQFNKYGFSRQDAAALQSLWNGESGWNPAAKNASSGAAGIPQALGHTLPADYATNPRAQIDWGLNYIKQRYQSPSRAWAFWQATVNKNANLAPEDLRQTAQYWIDHGYGGY